jgi:threonine aldolase
VQTNIVIFELREGADATTVISRAAERGVLVVAFGPRRVRAVTHLDVSREQCTRAADVLVEVVNSVS